mgnify:CR=1 FL=1
MTYRTADNTQDVLGTLAGEIGARPTGTAANEAVNRYLEGIARDLGFDVTAALIAEVVSPAQRERSRGSRPAVAC